MLAAESGSAARALRASGLLLALLACAGCGDAPRAEPIAAPEVAAPAHPVRILLPGTLGMIDTDQLTSSGTPAGIACATCHAAASDSPLAERSGASGFHGGVQLLHGGLSCHSCHAPADRTRLRLADGEQIAFGEVMRLCGQCHGPQLRDYEHGAHGGMRGYWDLSRGPRERNSCVVCHGAHQPAYPRVLPEPPPRDRFLRSREPASPTAREGDGHES